MATARLWGVEENDFVRSYDRYLRTGKREGLSLGGGARNELARVQSSLMDSLADVC